MKSDLIHVFQVAKSTGGIGEYIRWIVGGLDKRRFRLTVACLSDGGPELAAELSRLSGVYAFSLGMTRFKIDPLSDSRVFFQLARIIRRERFDLIHAHVSKPGFLVRLAAAGTDVPVVYSPHCFAFHDGVSRGEALFYAALERFAARFLTARIINVSDAERALARRYGVGRDEQFTTIHSGIDPRPFEAPVDIAAQRASLGAPAEAPLVGIVARLSPPKAPLDFVGAAAQVHAHRPDVHFVWVGSGPLEAQTRQAVAESGLTDVFHFAGHRRDVPPVMRALTCFALSSHWEGFPLTVLEAMAAGIPVVATRVMGIPEAVSHGETGLLVPPRNPAALALALLDLLGDPMRLREFGANGRKRVAREFSREAMIARLERVYEEVYAAHALNRARARPQVA
jgi:glycosyltransferase involved in cell wall biosynthesis